MSIKSIILVIFQGVLLLYLIISGTILLKNILVMLQLLGIFIAVWGVVAMRIGNFNIQPEVRSKDLIIKGPYRLIRNPMYLGIILFFIPTILYDYTLMRLTAYLLLIIILLLKVFSEEKFLEERFGQVYKAYKEKTYRLIPYIF